MLKNRVCYVLLLLCTGAFFICFNGYTSLYVFALSVALPLLSLLVSLPGMLGVRAELSLGGPAGEEPSGGTSGARKGTALPLRIQVHSRFPYPSGRSRVRLTVRNTLTGESREERFTFTAGRAPQILEHSLSSPRCGLVLCRLSKGRTCDLLGLFSLPLRLKQRAFCSAYFYPAVYAPDLTVLEGHIPDAEGERYSPTKPGDDPSELFGLREYREGDRLSRIHWKLSQKADQTLVKELSLPISDHLFFLLDLNGTGEEADTLLDVFATFSTCLAERGTAHRVGFRDAKTGRLRLLEVSQPEDARPALEAVLSAGGRAPLPELARRDLPAGVSHALYLCCEPQAGVSGLLRDTYPSARLSIVRAAEDLGASRESRADADLAGAELTVVKPGRILEALNGFVL